MQRCSHQYVKEWKGQDSVDFRCLLLHGSGAVLKHYCSVSLCHVLATFKWIPWLSLLNRFLSVMRQSDFAGVCIFHWDFLIHVSLNSVVFLVTLLCRPACWLLQDSTFSFHSPIPFTCSVSQSVMDCSLQAQCTGLDVPSWPRITSFFVIKLQDLEINHASHFLKKVNEVVSGVCTHFLVCCQLSIDFNELYFFVII